MSFLRRDKSKANLRDGISTSSSSAGLDEPPISPNTHFPSVLPSFDGHLHHHGTNNPDHGYHDPDSPAHPLFHYLNLCTMPHQTILRKTTRGSMPINVQKELGMYLH